MNKSQLNVIRLRLNLSKKGHDLLDKKVFILSKEISDLKQKRDLLKKNISETLDIALQSIINANIEIGLNRVQSLSQQIPHIQIEILQGSIMGTEVSLINYKDTNDSTENDKIENKTLKFTVSKYNDIKNLCLLLAMLEDSIQKLNHTFKKTEIRVNALKNIVIPKQEAQLKMLLEIQEEQEREVIGRLNSFR